MTLLDIIKSAAQRLSLARPSAVVSSTDEQVLQLLALANEAGHTLARRADWQILTTEKTFITVAAEQQVSAVPDDFDRFVPDTVFNRTAARKVYGPVSTQDWQAIQAQGATQPANNLFRIRGGYFLITPAPTAGETVAYEYVSKKWAASDAGVPKESFTADQDTCLLDPELLIQEIRWRFKQAKGLDYAEDMRTAEINIDKAVARDGGLGMVSIGQSSFDSFALNIPQTIPTS